MSSSHASRSFTMRAFCPRRRPGWGRCGRCVRISYSRRTTTGGVVMADLVTRERYGHVLLIRINRPDKRNAFSLALIDEFAAAYEEFGDDPELWAAAVFAHGDHFSAGLDLAEVGPAVAERGPAALASSRRYDPFGMWAPQVPKPVVLAVQESPSRCPLNWRWPATSSSPRTMSGSGNSRSRAGSCRSGSHPAGAVAPGVGQRHVVPAHR